ncbi:MAG: DegT/DnrJ/EryC1/StrS aminotransferase family protein [Coxiellaceae bacterium]|jgi:dTDP-4-amino-4,6-dideoxygalactose transaminase|nr:DegT/DnrJ/EryC1/StrS aminotransferase family protein [Coxiellaceae bacterium]
MNDEFLKFCTPDINQETIDEVVSCLRSGWLATGPRVKHFEEDLKQYLKAPYILALNSATSGLHLALKCFGLKAQDEVITTPMTFIASLNTIIHTGAKPVLVDVDLKTRNIDVTKIEAKITKNTKAILPVHFAGVPVDLDLIYKIAKKYNLRVLEDCAHAMGSHYQGKILGSFGDTQVFSFHPNKVMTTGEGGCLATRDEELTKKISVQRFHGIDREAWNRYGKEGTQHYDVIQPGHKYNMMDLQAAIGIHQLKELENFITKRQKLVDRYNEILTDWPELTLPQLPNYQCCVSWYIYAPLINPEIANMSRDTFMERMKEYNIGTGYHHHAAHLYTYYQNTLGYKKGQFPNAETISNRIVSLPLFTTMTINDQDRTIEAMKKVFKKR